MSWGQGSRGKEECFGGRAAAPGRGCRSPSRRPPVLTGSRAAAPRAAGVRAAATRAAAHRGPHGCFHPVRIPPIRRCCTLSASPAHPPRRAAARRGRREGCGSARPAPFASLSAPVVLCCAQGQLSRTEGRSNEERGTEGYRNEERGTAERGTALLHGLAPSRRACPKQWFLFAQVYRRHADRAVLRPSSGCRHRATSTVQHLVLLVRSGCDPSLSRPDCNVIIRSV